MARFFVSMDLAKATTVTLDPKESRHALKVLRLKAGDVVDLFDASGRAARGIVVGGVSGRLVVSIDAGAKADFAGARGGPAIDLAISLIKPERMELLVQKCSELGARRILPVVTERSIVKLSAERRQGKVVRWQKIALESCKQCGRASPPEIAPVMTFSELLSGFGGYDRVLMPTLGIPTVPLVHALDVKRPSALLAIIGPEGDLSPEEARRAADAGARAVSLGPLVLRSETAAFFVLSALDFYYREVCHEKV